MAGGAIMFGSKTETVGTRNCQAALHYLKEEKIRVVARHLGGRKGRGIHFSLKDWSVAVEMNRKIVAVI